MQERYARKLHSFSKAIPRECALSWLAVNGKVWLLDVHVAFREKREVHSGYPGVAPVVGELHRLLPAYARPEERIFLRQGFVAASGAGKLGVDILGELHAAVFVLGEVLALLRGMGSQILADCKEELRRLR